MPSLARPLLCAALLATAACPTSPGVDVVRPATLEFHEDPVVVEVPATATAGVPFPVTVHSYGGGCVRQGDTRVQVRGAVADVTPRVVEHRGQNVVCTRELRIYLHEAAVRFDAPGTATVRVHGLRHPAAEPITVTRTVRVQPAG